MIKRVLLGLVALLVLLAVAVGINTVRQGSRQLDVPAIPVLAIDKAAVSANLAEAVRARTIASSTDPLANADQFAQFQALLQARYPKLHAALKREVVGDRSLLYTWQGSDTKAQPMMLMAHQDVVPISPGTETQWTEAPFSGAIKDGFIWGRGAWDDKGNLMAELEAVEMLVASGYQPQRTVYLSFGADEEVGGRRGAALVAALLKQRGVRLDFVIDEGLLITEGILPGISAPTAVVGIAEKGFMSVVVKVSATPGHSSMPPPKGSSAIAMMSAALRRVDDDQMPASLGGAALELFATIAPEMGGMGRVAMSNLWLFGPLVQKQLEAAPSTNAMLRTTTALTTISAGNADNVLPGQVEATVNYRLLPGDTSVAVLARLREQLAQTVGAGKFELAPTADKVEASPVSPTNSWQYQLINRTVREVFPGAIVAPGLLVGGTDSRYLNAVSDHVFRFSPVRAKAEDLARFHGTNERISTDNFAEMIRFYHRLLSMGAQASQPEAKSFK